MQVLKTRLEFDTCSTCGGRARPGEGFCGDECRDEYQAYEDLVMGTDWTPGELALDDR